jgi:hypothetical protein
MGELQVIGGSLVTKHDAVEAVVVVKPLKHFKSESISVELHDFGQMVCGARHPQMRFCQTYCCLVHRLLLTRNYSDSKRHSNAAAGRAITLLHAFGDVLADSMVIPVTWALSTISLSAMSRWCGPS